MKVAVIHNLRRGGAHRRLKEQVSWLGCDVVEICLSTAAPVTASPTVVDCRRWATKAPQMARPPLRYLDLNALQRAWRHVAETVEAVSPDVVFANPCQFAQAPPALALSSTPSLYFCDEPREPPGRMILSRNPRTRRLYRHLHETEAVLDVRAVAHATRLVTNSCYTAEAIRRRYGREARVLPMGVPNGFSPGSEPRRHLLSVGTLIPDKGHDLAVQAAARARTRRPVLVVAPRPAPNEERRLRQLARSLGIDLSIRVAISDTDLITCYRQAHATLYLARGEPFGLAALEAQACGSPVVVSAEGGLPETLLQGETGWAVERQQVAVAAALDTLDDPTVHAEFAAAAAVHAGRATWRASARALEGALRDVSEFSAGRQPSR